MSTGTCVVGFSTSIAFDLIDFFLSEWVAEYGHRRAKGEGAAARISLRIYLTLNSIPSDTKCAGRGYLFFILR